MTRFKNLFFSILLFFTLCISSFGRSEGATPPPTSRPSTPGTSDAQTQTFQSPNSTTSSLSEVRPIGIQSKEVFFSTSNQNQSGKKFPFPNSIPNGTPGITLDVTGSLLGKGAFDRVDPKKTEFTLLPLSLSRSGSRQQSNDNESTNRDSPYDPELARFSSSITPIQTIPTQSKSTQTPTASKSSSYLTDGNIISIGTEQSAQMHASPQILKIQTNSLSSSSLDDHQLDTPSQEQLVYEAIRPTLVLLQYSLLVTAGVVFLAVILYSIYYIRLIKEIYDQREGAVVE